MTPRSANPLKATKAAHSAPTMAFVPLCPLPLSRSSSLPLQHSPFPHRFYSVRPPRVHMCATNNPDEEVSVPLSSLKDLKSTPTGQPSPSTESQQIDQQDQQQLDLRSEKQKEIDRLRAAEKFITVDEGNYECSACGYVYEKKKGIRQSNISPDTFFEDLPSSFVCPVCRSPKSRFVAKKKIIAGFADNQSYGFGSNTLTGGQKSALIFGGLLACFLLLLSGYALN